jgi:hypothetical protein
MSTTSHNPNEGNVPPARVPRRQSLTNAESEAGNFLGSLLLSRSILRGGSYGCDRSEVSDDELITAAQRGDQQALVALRARQSSWQRRRYSGSFRMKRTRKTHLGKMEANSFATLVTLAASSRSRRPAHLVGTRKANVLAISSESI